MPIDRNERTRIAVRIRKDSRLTPTAKHVGQTLLFFFMGALGRAWPSYETLAAEAGVSVSSAKRAIPMLVAAGYLTKTRRWGRSAIRRAGKWMPHCLSNLYVWAARLMSAKSAQEPRPLHKPIPPAPLPEGLSRVLARFGNGIADRSGLPAAPVTT